MSNTQWKAIIYGAVGFLAPQIIIWLIFGAYLLLTGHTHG